MKRSHHRPHPEDPQIARTQASGDRSIAAGRDITLASTGDNAVNVIQQAENFINLPAEAFNYARDGLPSTCVTNLPRPSNLFVGRRAALAQLDESLDHCGPTVVRAVHGLGGVGKSTLVAQWAHGQRNKANPTWWITAESPDALQTGLASLMTALEPALGQILPREALADRAMHWLANHSGWLLVLDNVNNPTDIQTLLSYTQSGQVIITSRRATGWHHTSKSIALDVLQADEALGLFVQILTHDAPRPTDGASEVCRELGNLPLAIEQAAAFCAETSTHPHDYLKMLSSHPADTYAIGPEGSDAERTISRIWKITLAQLDNDPLPTRILRTLCWYAPDAIPRELIVQSTDTPPPSQMRAVGRLIAHSMLSSNPETGALSMHRLVQAVIRSESDSLRYRHTAANQLLRNLPEDPEHDPHVWPEWWSLVPHVEAFIHHASRNADHGILELIHSLSSMASIFFHSQKEVPSALNAMQNCLNIVEHLRGHNTPELIPILRNIGMLYQELGQKDAAIQNYERAKSITQEHFDEENEESLDLLIFTSSLYLSQGNFDKSLADAKRAFRLGIKIIPPGDGKWVSALRVLGEAYCANRITEKGIPYLKAALNLVCRLDSPHHPHAATVLRSLSMGYVVAGNPKEALICAKSGLKIVRTAYGSNHLVSVEFSLSVARLLFKVGQLDESLSTYIEVIECDSFGRLSLTEQADSRLTASEILWRFGDLDGELTQLQYALELLDEKLPSSPLSLDIASRIIMIHGESGRPEAAMNFIHGMLTKAESLREDGDAIKEWAETAIANVQRRAG
ncbi:tetratricopeptide repeat protein [Streptomyces nigrescens]|uniref:tetratricopeptide repeat protein n=1 Tax=Streptomyces nigrescens TaxID=1920 RepID=UPI0036F954C0